MGSTEDRSCHRVLKVDRTVSHGDGWPLVEEDDGEYTEKEVRELIEVLDQCSGDGRGLESVATSFGIVGWWLDCVKQSDSYTMCVCVRVCALTHTHTHIYSYRCT